MVTKAAMPGMSAPLANTYVERLIGGLHYLGMAKPKPVIPAMVTRKDTGGQAEQRDGGEQKTGHE
jgi:hypothetical protein